MKPHPSHPAQSQFNHTPASQLNFALFFTTQSPSSICLKPTSPLLTVALLQTLHPNRSPQACLHRFWKSMGTKAVSPCSRAPYGKILRQWPSGMEAIAFRCLLEVSGLLPLTRHNQDAQNDSLIFLHHLLFNNQINFESLSSLTPVLPPCQPNLDSLIPMVDNRSGSSLAHTKLNIMSYLNWHDWRLELQPLPKVLLRMFYGLICLSMHEVCTMLTQNEAMGTATASGGNVRP